jgi:hypothetical protein
MVDKYYKGSISLFYVDYAREEAENGFNLTFSFDVS